MTALLIDPKGGSHFVKCARICEPISGQWHIEGRLVDEGDGVTGACVFRFGGAEWRGIIVPEFSGEWGGSFSFRLLAGGGGWGKRIKAKGYHSDGGVKGRTVATDAARDCGETLGAFDGEGVLGVDYARPAGLASTTLEDAAGMASWWVGRDGVTRVGTRIASGGEWPGALDWDPSSQVATLEGDDPSRLEVSATLVDARIGAKRKIRDLEIVIEGETVRAYAWCGGESSLARMSRLIRAIIAKATEGPLFGSYRYRVVSMAPDGRVNLQSVRKKAGVPDLLPIDQWPGLAGTHAELAEGAEVLVEFEEGDRSMPYVAHWTPKRKAGHSPQSISFLEGSRPFAKVGDPVVVFLGSTPVPIVGTVAGVGPFTGTATFATPLTGMISGGDPRIKGP